jgi:hypothetical protein
MGPKSWITKAICIRYYFPCSVRLNPASIDLAVDLTMEKSTELFLVVELKLGR